MYSDFYEIPLPALRFEKVEETDTKKSEKRRHRRETTPSKFDKRQRDRKKTTLKGKADSLVRKNDTQRKLKNASRIKAVAIRKIKLPHSKNGRH